MLFGECSTKAHRLDRGRREDNDHPLFTDCFVKHLHAEQMQSAWIFALNTRCLAEFVGDVCLSIAKGDVRLALGLCLLGLGNLQF